MLGPFATYIGFYANRSYIASNLCENKDNPVSDCHGSCYLTNELAKSVEVTKESKQDMPETLVFVHIFSPHTTFDSFHLIYPTRSAVYGYDYYDVPVSASHIVGLLDPPRV